LASVEVNRLVFYKMENKDILRKKLEISKNNDVSLFYPENQTRNTTYILKINEKPKYFIKEKARKSYQERRTFDFLEKHPIIPTIFPIYKDEEHTIFPYKKLENADVGKYFDFIPKMQNELMEVPSSEYLKYFNEKKFKNKRLEKFQKIVDYNEKYLSNFWDNPGELKEFWKKTYGENNNIPLVLNHGDFHPKNFQKDEKGNLLLVDFEEVCYDTPSWELARALQSNKPKYFNFLKDMYLDEINIKDKRTLDKLIKRDFLVRTVCDGIGMQTILSQEKVKPYLDFIREFSPIIKNLTKS